MNAGITDCGERNVGWGSLGDDDFTLDGTDYTVESLRWGTGSSNKVHLTLDRDFPAASLSKLTLEVDSQTYALSSATRGGQDGMAPPENNYKWTRPSTWTRPAKDDTITVKLLKDVATPAKPTGFTAAAGNAQVTLSWTNPGDSSITKYQYQQKEGNNAWGNWTNIPNSAPGGTNATSYTVTNLTNGTVYRFRIRAVNADGNGTQSNEVQATPSSAVLSSDNTLSGLSVTSATSSSGPFSALPLTPSTFSATTTSYTATVPHATTHVKLTPVANEENASVVVLEDTVIYLRDLSGTTSAIPLGVGANAIIVQVTAQNASMKDYTVTITRQASTTTVIPPAKQTVQPGWRYIPSGVGPGKSFRLLFPTSGRTRATSSNIDDYNTHVKNAANNNPALQPFKDEFRALASTETVDARDNTATTGTGVPIYWLGDAKVADHYADFYDGSWDSKAPHSLNRPVWTGSSSDGTKATEAGNSRALGTPNPAYGLPRGTGAFRLFRGTDRNSVTRSLYALSPVITVQAAQVTPKVSLVPGSSTIAESGSGNSTTLKATLPSAVSSAVTVTLTASPSGKVTFSGTTLTIPANARESGTVTVTAVDNAAGDGNARVAISGAVSGTAVTAPDNITLTVRDDDVPTSVPAKPEGLSVTPGNAQVRLSWTDPGDSTITKYQYLRQQWPQGYWGDWTDIPNSAPGQTNATSWTLASPNGKAVTFRIRAVNALGTSRQSDKRGPVWPRQTATVKPAKPDLLGPTASPNDGLSPGTVRLWWNDLRDPTVGKWQVSYRNITAGEGASHRNWHDIPHSHARTIGNYVVGLVNEDEYGFRIRAVNALGAGPESDEVKATPNWRPGTVVANGIRLSRFYVEAGSDRLKLGWKVIGRPGHSGYVIKWKHKDATEWKSYEFQSYSHFPDHTITGLAGGANYDVQVYVLGSHIHIPDALAFESLASSRMAPPPITAAPALSSARVNGASMMLGFDAALDDTSVPAGSAFVVSVAGSPRSVSAVAVTGERVLLTLASAVSSGEVVTVGYTPPSTGKLRTSGGGAEVAAFTGQTVTNDTPVS
ncbi:MAG: fibronectin type III domain-containing protein, partial [Paracoccaceae bacterium]|nr:fibronectin type III domain-containing protein [Paracoccaceae bacterium]